MTKFLLLFVASSLPASACGGCAFNMAYFSMPWLWTWLKICLAWWLLGFVLRGRTRSFAERLSSLGLGGCAIVGGGIMLGPIPAFLALALWLFEYLRDWFGFLGKQLDPDKRPYFFASHFLWAALIVSALFYLKQDAEQGPQGPLSRVRSAHGGAAGAMTRWAVSQNFGLADLEEFYNSPLPEVRMGSMVIAREFLRSGKLQPEEQLETLVRRAITDKNQDVVRAAQACLSLLEQKRPRASDS